MKNNFVNGISIFVQTMFVFGFLVIFYFLYVINIEQEDFGKQMDLIIDDLTKTIKDDLPNLIDTDKINTNDYDVIVSGIIY